MVTENGIQSDGNTSFLRAARAGNLEKVLEHLKNNVDINTCNANGLNALHLASKDGHVHIVSELLKRGAAVDNSTKKGNTALHIASLAGQEEVVKLLLQYNASVNAQSQNGFSPLYMASQENHDSVVKLLLASGANQSLATEDGFTPLLVAMQQGHDKVVAVLLESDTRGKVRLPALHIAAKKDDVRAATLLLENDHNPDVTSKSGFTPLHIASHYGNEAIANLLIQKGADVNFPAKHNITPLHVSCKWGKSNMVSLLLEKGANIESKTRDGLTPLHCSARSGHEQVVDMLLERGAPISAKTKNGLAPLHMSAQGEHVDAARILLYHRAPVDEVTVDYLTALHVAAHCGHVRVAKLLLDRNADANARALNGFTPLHIACKKNRIKVVELLLKHGASISATTESGLTPLHVASFMGCMNIVIYLLQNEASPDQPTCRGETPLHLACRANQTDIIRILLRNGAQVDARAREQQTALHIASRLGNVDIVMLLLQHGAQVDNTTRDMYTALHIAAKEGQDEVAAVLIDNGASLEASTKKGFQPLHLAAKYGQIKVAELLLQKGAPVDAQGKNGVTPLHVSAHYDHQNVALLLLNKGASPVAVAKNGHTALHISARKNQMDIATTLLEYGAQAESESRAGFTPLHLSSQEGHVEMSNLLLEHKANSNHQAKNGLTPLHLCAQEDRTNVAKILIEKGANVNAKTKNANTALHIASHFGQLNMVRFLLENGANVNADSAFSMTPLHQAAQQGHLHIVNILLEHKANPDALTLQGQTPLNISQKLGYISVVESLKNVTQSAKDQMQTSTNEGEKYRVVAPEAMHETFMSDSEEEGGDDVNTDHPYRYLTVDEMKSLGDDSLPIDVTRDERIDSNRMAISTDSNNMNISQNEDIITPQHVTQTHVALDGKYAIDNIKIERHPEQIGKLHWKNFLVSFLVDARGGAMRGCRHSGIRIIVPPRSCAMPTRITCRYVKPQRTLHPPQLMEGEALASRVLELGPVAAKFIGPVIMEVPHFASLRGKEREIVILRSDNGETWREHQVENSDEIIHDTLNEYFEPGDINQLDESSGGRICRFVTYDFPQYFAVVSRIRQEFIAIGPDGGMVSSTVIPAVQAIFPQGALTKKIKVGLQAQPIDPDLTAKLLGRGVAVSPIVTVEPRRRKFHKAITLSMPAPKAHSQGMINQYSGNAPTLRLLCSITGGPSRAQWEDVTGSTPLTFVNDCVSFTTTVSARFWLMDCRNISEATKMATDLYREAIHVPFMAKFVVFAKRTDPFEARLRVFCMTDDKEDKTLEYQEHFTEVAKSRDVEVFEGKPQYTEFAGNLVPVTKSGEQLQIHFKAFRENRLPFNVRVKDQHADTVGRALFMREQRVAKGEQPQQPICILNIVLPEQIYTESVDDNRDLKYRNDRSNLNNIRIVDISNLLGQDWIRLAHELGFTEQEINEIIADNPTSTPRKAQSMLQNYISREDSNRTVLETSLRSIKRDDIIKKCLRLSLYLEKPKPSASGTRKGSSFEEVDNMKDSESVEELAVHEREELKYSAEEKIVENSDGESQEDEIVERSVAERREQITKRLSIERPIPASTQQKEIVQEVAEIKRRSLIEDKKALHEEEIIMHAPTDNIIIKSATIPEPVIKLKSGIKDDVDVTKSDFDRELHDKFKITIKDSESFEHKVTSDLAETISCVDEKIQIDTVTTEKFHKIDTLFDNIEINAEVTPSDKVEPIKELLDHKQIEDLLEPVIATKILESSISTKNFLDNEVKAQSEHVVTQQDPKKAEVIPNTITTTLAIETARDHSQPIESSKDAGTVNYTVQKKAETFLQGNNDADEFYKTIEEKITKKMSQDFSIYKNDDIRDESDEILVSQTPPPTPNETNQQQKDIHEDLHSVESPQKLEDDLNDASSTNDSRSLRSLITPKPTPRSFNPNNYDAIASETVDDVHTSEIDKDDNRACTAIDRSSGDFSETKKFWQSLESGSIDDPNISPIPKPRSQSHVQVRGVRYINDDFDTVNLLTSITPNEQNISQTSLSNKDIDRHNVPITDHLNNVSPKLSDHNDIILHSAEKYSASIYNVKERENILDDDDDEDVLNEKKTAAFYIGESSGDLITKSAIEKQPIIAYDIDGKELKDVVKLDQKTEIECSDYKYEVRFNLQPEEIGVASYGKLDNIQQIRMHKSLEEKCETEIPENVILESPNSNDQAECSKSCDTSLEQATINFQSKIELKETAEQFEYTAPTCTISKSQEIEKNIDEERIETFEPVKMAETILLQSDHSTRKILDSTEKVQFHDKAVKVCHAPIDTLSNVSQNIDEIKIASNERRKNEKSQFEFDSNMEHYDIIEPKTTLVVNIPVENLNQEQYIEVEAIESESTQKPKFQANFVHEFSDKITSEIIKPEDNIIDYTLDPDEDKIYPVAHMNMLLRQECSNKMETRVGEVSQKQSTDESSLTTSKSEVIHRTGSSKGASKTRWSLNEQDHSSPSSHSVDNSRPCSSDIENLYVSYPNSSGEYQTALDASSLIPGSTEYHTAVSSFDHSGKTISSEESMKSFDSEISSNLGSIEVSDASETLVPSTADIDLEFDENELRLSSLHTVSDIILDAENPLELDSDESAGQMRRSHEMIFAHVESSNTTDMPNRKVSEEEFNVQQFSTTLGDASNLSISFSTASNADTIIENIQEDMATSYDAVSLVGSYERRASLMNDIFSSQEKVPHAETDNDRITEIDNMTPRRSKGHKRNDSTCIDLAKLSQESTDSLLDEEMIIHDVREEDEQKESGSDSDYDRYETEYSRSFKTPESKNFQRKKKAMSPKSAQKPEQEQTERKKSIPNIETIVEVSEDDIQKLRNHGISQNMNIYNYSIIPNIKITDITDDPTKCFEKMEPITVPEKKTDKSGSELDTVSKDTRISEAEYEKLIERQYKNQEDLYESKVDSDLCDSFELVEQPDISDEFVIIEEVAREANELMTEGQSVSIQQTQYVKKHDDEVERIIIKSAPAATNEGSTLLQGRHDLAFEFEESPSSGANTESSEDGAGIESSRKWIEMQLAEQAQNLRYPYDIDRGALEDIKEEDTDFEIGSSRISSFKDSYSSNDFEVAGTRRYQIKDHDNISVNSLQEFERLEQAISLENKKFHSSSNDSFSNGSFPKRGLRTAQADEISLCSLQDFEGLENACLEATLLELKAKEEHALLFSCSDESNKSNKLDRGSKVGTIASKLKFELEEDISYQMEVSTDSLEAKQISKKLTYSKNASQHGSSDSLEISRSADIMTSSIDSIEISKDGITSKTSKSECDSIEQSARVEKRDSIESIDAQYAVMNKSSHVQSDSVDENLLDLCSSSAIGGTTEIKITTSVASSGYGGCISKDISSDSLNLNLEPELLVTSTESPDNTCSTFATYQIQTDSQMTMSGSLTSCDSNTLVDSCETINYNDSSNVMPDNTIGASTTLTTTSINRSINRQ